MIDSYAVRTTATYLQTVVDAIPEITVVIDRDRRITFANESTNSIPGPKAPESAWRRSSES